ncbi:hypothetical protein N0V95_006810 [Ascochyta clinopodiicola]|nr:hypothetical protein N0V95_006810 [Ascochyta clinopodiicola]
MADARTLLRQQRAVREQAKKSAAPAAAPVSKKRKAADDGPEEKKRSRTEQAAGVPAGFFDAGAELEEVTEELEQTPTAPQAQLKEISKPAPPPLDPSAEAELDAFLTEMNKEPTPPPPRTYASGAVIEAAPMTAAELAAQAREEQSAQRARRDEDMEAEKEEAARALEDEFEEMEGLDERVKKLRDQREALRSQSAQLPAPMETSPAQLQADVEESESDGDEDEDEDWDDWRFRPA